ncbi:MAG: flagellar brake protein, partial [Gallionella sp.]
MMSNKGQTEQRGSTDDFLSLGANVGDALQLQDMMHGKHRYYAKLIGYLNKHSIVVTYPQLDGELITAQIGEAFQVRGFSGRVTYEFTATVLNVSSKPFPYLHLSYPESVSTLEMRGAMRIKTQLACSVIANIGALKMPATIVDLSTSG